MEDEGRPFGVGFREPAPNRPRAASVKSRGRERWGKRQAMSLSGEDREDERKRTADDVSKISEPTSEPGASPSSGIRLGGGPEYCPTGVRHKGGVSLIRAFLQNVRTCRRDAKGEGQAGRPRKAESTEAWHRGGAARSRDEGPVMGPDRRGRIVQPNLKANQRWEEPRG